MSRLTFIERQAHHHAQSLVSSALSEEEEEEEHSLSANCKASSQPPPITNQVMATGSMTGSRADKTVDLSFLSSGSDTSSFQGSPPRIYEGDGECGDEIASDEALLDIDPVAATLLERFPTATLQEVERTLDQEKHHAGRAAARLRQFGRVDTASRLRRSVSASLSTVYGSSDQRRVSTRQGDGRAIGEKHPEPVEAGGWSSFRDLERLRRETAVLDSYHGDFRILVRGEKELAGRAGMDDSWYHYIKPRRTSMNVPAYPC